MSHNFKTLSEKSLLAFLFSFYLTSASLSEEKNIFTNKIMDSNYIRMNDEKGIIYNKRDHKAIKADLYIDKDTINNNYPSIRLELTALLDLENTKVGIFNAFTLAKKLKIRDSPIIVKEDIIKYFVKISKDYENEINYKEKFTNDLSSLLDESLASSYPPKYKLIIESSDKLVTISSYDSEGNLLENSKFIFIDEKASAYNSWISERIKEDFEEIQDEKREGRETHLSYVRNVENLTIYGEVVSEHPKKFPFERKIATSAFRQRFDRRFFGNFF